MQTTHRVQHPSAVRRRTVRSVWAFVLAGATAAVMTGCGFQIEEALCGGGEYPVLAVGSTGGDCVPNGEQPPAGYARYPEGKAAEHVGDKWDTYWSTHTLDEHGNVVDASDAG
ncbi:SCO0607 family lipoprotein [Streptomyces bobili]|uniref:SCO0607 family lipoprotein n=1 Tax=Streptomyces bobili TaxID=67280 RepID=UPI0037202E54